MVNSNRIVGGGQRSQIAGANPGFQGRLNQPRNRPKSDLAGNEGGYRDLVRRIVDRGCSAASSQGLIGQSKRREPLKIRSLEGQLPDLGEIEFGRGTCD